MGLDITMYKVVHSKDEGAKEVYTFDKDETNKSILALKEKFANYIEKVENEYYDYEKAVEEGILKPGYEIVGMLYGDEIKFIVEYEDRDDPEEIDADKIPIKIQTDEVLYGIEVGYQRKCMKTEFYTEFVSGCWYVSNDSKLSPDDSNEVVVTKEAFERAKEFLVGSECPMNEWNFVEGEHFIDFSY